MRNGVLAFCALIGASGWCHTAASQSANDIINIFGGIVQTAINQAIQAEWRKISLDEISCIDENLRQRGSSLSTVVQQNIGPSDARILDVRAACRRATVQQPSAPTKEQPPISAREPSPLPVRDGAISAVYSVDNLVLGGNINRESAAYREYQCGPSEQFSGLTRCQKRVPEKTQRGSFVSTYSLLHSADGTLSYINRFLEPAWFGTNEASEDIARLARKFGAQPNLITMPQKAGSMQGIIATWGTVKLQPVEANDAAQLALGLSARLGLMIDFLGNFRRSAHEGLPVFRLVGGAGFVWAANWDQNGRGTLRFFAVDADALSAKEGSQAGNPPVDVLTTLPPLSSPPLSAVPGSESPDQSSNPPRR
jgi:hypothetical protein